MLKRLRFSVTAVRYVMRDCDFDSLEEIAYWDGEHDVENMIKCVTRPGGTVTVGTGSAALASLNNGIDVSISAEENLKLCAPISHLVVNREIPMFKNLQQQHHSVGHRENTGFESNIESDNNINYSKSSPS
jgi:hypothetical protein